MAFLDAAEEGGGAPAPQAPAPPQGGAPQPNPMQGGGQVLAALANRQRRQPVSAPGPGDQASSMTMLMQAIGMMQNALPGLQAGTPIQQDTLKALQRLSKHVPQGAPAAGVQKTQLEDLLRNLVKNVLLSRILGQQQQRPGPGQEQASPVAAAAQPPMPSTPLPGA